VFHREAQKDGKEEKQQILSDVSTVDNLEDLSDASTEDLDVSSREASHGGDIVLSDDDGVVDKVMGTRLPFQYPEIEVPEYSEYAWDFQQLSEWMPMGYDSDPMMCAPVSPVFATSQMSSDLYSPVQWGQQTIGSSQYQPTNTERTASWADLTVARTQEWRTTVMLRNVPTSYTREMLLDLIDSLGFAGSYDFAYLPMEFSSQAALGYAFINFVSAGKALLCFDIFEGFSDWKVPSEKFCSVTWSSPNQGLQAHIERYQNSPVMHHSLPDEWKPVLFQHGVRVPFPLPTRPIKTPKVRQHSSAKSA
jgi:hypothetical protein